MKSTTPPDKIPKQEQKPALTPFDGDHSWASEDDIRLEQERQEWEETEWLREMEEREQTQKEWERWSYEALSDPASDAYYSSGAREARIDAGIE